MYFRTPDTPRRGGWGLGGGGFLQPQSTLFMEGNNVRVFTIYDYAFILSVKLTITAISRKKHSMVGPNRSSYGPEPLRLIAVALQ